MGTPYIGEIKMISWNFAPQGWAFCNGQLLPINQNQALFSLYGTTYGGDGRVNFALPNLQGRVMLHQGDDFIGTAGGETAHTLSLAEMPQHVHIVNADATQAPVSGGNAPGSAKRLSDSQPGNLYGPPNNLQPMNPGAVSNVGGGQPHTNMQPYLVLNFICALQGIFPSRN